MIDKIEELLDMGDTITDLCSAERKFSIWNKGDCSEVGLCEILLDQLIRKHKEENGEWYDRDYDEIKLRY
jgi:hypothetical protein